MNEFPQMRHDRRSRSQDRSPLEIAIICNDADYFLRHRSIIADRLAELGNHVTVLAGGRPMADQSAGWRSRFIRIERFGFHFFRDAKLAWTTVAESAARRLDTLYLITLKPAVVCGLTAVLTRSVIGRPKRVVITLAGLGRLLGPSSPSSVARSLCEWALRRMGKREGFVFTFETEHDRQFFLASGIVDRSRSIAISGAGVDPAVFHPRAAERRPGPLRILFASRLLRAKGLDTFLLAAERWDRPQDAEFLVAGFADDGDPDAYRPHELASHPSIRFLGSVADMADLLRSVDIVCLPSRYGEGIPRVLIEAAASGLASIASDLEGCQAIVEDGRTGFLLDTADADQASAGICSVLSTYLDEPELLRRHSAAAYEKFLAGGFQQDLIVEQFVRLLAPQEIAGSA